MSIRNKKKSRYSVYHLLTINYICFTLLLFAVFFGIYTAWSRYVGHYASIPDPEGFLQEVRELPEDQLASFPLSRYLGEGSAFSLYDGEGALLYQTAAAGGSRQELIRLSLEERKLLPEYGSSTRYLSTELPDRSREGGSVSSAWMVSRLDYRANGDPYLSGYLLLDEDLRVQSGSLFPGKDQFTETDLQLLRGRDDTGRRIFRCSYTNSQGADRQLIFRYRPRTEGPADPLRSMGMVWLFLIPAYLIIMAVSALYLSRRVRAFLSPLNRAIRDYSLGEADTLPDYKGPKEILEIAESFNQMEDRLQKSESERKRMEADRRQLLADISHDLKTPITVIAGYAEALRDQVVPEDQKGYYLDTIVQKTRTVGELLTAFHDFEKLEHPEMRAKTEPVDLSEFTREYLAGRYQELGLGHFTLEAEIPEEPIYCALDQSLFTRVLDNLINNAMCYNPPGTRILAELQVQEGEAVLSIADDGRGIPEELKDRIFDPFVTGDDSRSQGHGSGLGLAIVNKIVGMHGGRVSLEEEPPQGFRTEFCIRLPLLPAESFTNL